MNSSATTTTPQTSAPVSKFRCLFSHDIRRKAKRWHDGILRYHSFNKRIMVYDTQSNFIGDLHWRDGEGLHDGDELELERGVLVQVGECVEQTLTDLTELLEKRKHATTSSPTKAFSPDASSRPALSAHSNNVAPNSSGRLKSLNELLGIGRARIGRAALPSKSPYEERYGAIRPDNDGADASNTERAPKRQRVHSREQGRDVDRSSWQNLLRDSGSHSSMSTFQPARDLVRNSVSTSSKSSSTDIPKTTNKGDRSKSQTIIDFGNPPGSVNILRMAIEKPRKKLMYKDLLAPQPRHHPTPRSQQNSREKQNSSVRTQRDSSPLPLPIENPDAEIENIPPVGPAFKSPAPTSTDINSTLQFIPSTSTLRAIQEAEPPPSSQKTKPINQFFQKSSKHAPPITTIKLQKEVVPSPVAQTPQTTAMACNIENSSPKSHESPQSPNRPSIISHSGIPPSSKQTKLTSHPTPPEPQINPSKPTIQRSDSLPIHISQPTITEKASQSAPAPSPPPPPPPPPRPQKPFQKAPSDPSSMLRGTTTSSTVTTTVTAPPTAAAIPRTRQSLLAPKRNQHVATCVDVDDGEEQGPWTEEALDLFDWWPPGRPKPESKKGRGKVAG
ncbi:conserved hypothetical protein [Histoplasma capsulatum G186AR]|uniref:5'-3' DNA helicase ZGRF1-like N-terminal domain-containing protein n=2 Tax=Ajellomyces capsulatus TaxID=5037 RepID=C0NDS3_AJECG|nr:uncharacterized protein HCBG_02016 [Histoplasma capsulatum G186AR]EEH10371.1 conserved hypothetical protein [Histoplasma capsulatum G186AR]KAG5290653.1 DUF2439 superfamily domain-containing protein [Histoplasma capsulatum]QSS72581.1 DUF2439 superfamily domain-containing protein [Histoplasma capsulatum G186AR]